MKSLLEGIDITFELAEEKNLNLNKWVEILQSEEQ